MKKLRGFLSASIPAFLTLGCLLSPALHAAAVRDVPGFRDNAVRPVDRDDGSVPIPALPFALRFGAATFRSAMLNNNGNITFADPFPVYIPESMREQQTPIIAAFWSDVDTTAGNVATYGTGQVNGRSAFGVNWKNVGYFDRNLDKLNDFQLILIDRSDTGAGNFDIEYNFDKIQWDVADRSRLASAVVGFSNGSGSFLDLPGSRSAGAFLDNGPNALITGRIGSTVPGRYVFQIRNGVYSVPPVLTVAGPPSLPVGIVGTPYLITYQATGGNGGNTWSATGLPPGLSMNSTTGVLSGVPTVASSVSYSVNAIVVDTSGTSASRRLELLIQPRPTGIVSPAALAPGMVGTVYPAVTFSASGGTGGYSWSASGLPAGLSITPAGVLSGMPAAGTHGTRAVVVTVRDSSNATTSRSYTLVINAAVLNVASPAALAPGLVGTVYPAVPFSASGGTGGYSWSASGLPGGLSITPAGTLSGTPAAGTHGSRNVVLTVKDLSNTTASRSYTLVINPAVLNVTTPAVVSPGMVATVYPAVNFTASGGTGGYSWSASGLPGGLSVTAAGILSGTPAAGTHGSRNVVVTVKDSGNTTASRSYTLVINPAVLIVASPAALSPGEVGTLYPAVTFAASGGTGGHSWSASGLPGGLSVTAAGVLSGTPAAGTHGSRNVVVTVKDSSNATVSRSYPLVIQAPDLLPAWPASLSAGIIGTSYPALTFTASGGTGGYAWSATGLPGGLVITPAGVLSGTPAAGTQGSRAVVVTVKDSSNVTAAKNYTLVVQPPDLLPVWPAALSPGMAGIAYPAITFTATGGTGTYSWSATGLPGAMTLTPAGVLSGTPALGTQGAYSIVVTLKDSGNITRARTYTLTIQPPSLVITGPVSLTSGVAGTLYPSVTFSAAGGVGGYTWSQTGLPGGLSLTPAGVLSGTPSPGTQGSHSVVVTVKDTVNFAAANTYSLTIAPQIPAITSEATLPPATVGTPYSTILSATGGTPPYSNWALTSGSLGSLALNPSNGQVSGTQGAAGTLSFSAIVRDSAGNTSLPKSFTINVGTAPVPRGLVSCIAEFAPRTIEFASAAGTATVTVIEPAECAWDAVSESPWLTIAAGQSGSGTRPLTFSAAENAGERPRTGSLRIGGQKLLVTQAGRSCTFSLSPGTHESPSAGDNGLIDVRTPTGCNWTVQSDATWITAAKSGIDRVSYSVAQNTSAASRPGTITIANQTFTFVQAGAGPSFSCVARSDPKTLRSEGITELIGDLILSCSGTAPPSIRGDVFVTFNLNVTSRLEGVQDFTDAVLLVNDPATVSVGTNAFKGKLTAPNVLRFSGVPIAAVSSGATTLRIKNVRLNAVLASSSSGSARFDIRSTISVPVTYPAGASGSVVVGTVADGLDASVGNPVPTAGVQILPVTFREKFVDGFKKQGVSGESGFVNPAVSPRAGVADTGTRLRLRINKVPSGVRIYAAVRNLNSPVTGAAQLFSADASGRGGVLQEGTALFGGAYLELSVAGEIATATWEVLEPLANGEDVYTFNIAVQNANADQLNSIRKEMLASFAHVSPMLNANANEVVPRFRDILAAPRLVNLTVVSRAVFVGTRAAEGKVVSRAAIGNNYSFNYDVINSSSEKATGVDVRGNMPAEFVYTGCTVDGGTCQLNGSDVSATLGEVAGGQTVTIQVSARQVEVVESRFLLESSIAVRSNEADTDPRDNEASSSFVLESCSTPLTPSAATIGVGGGPGTFAINAACGDWTVQSTTDWITITGAKNGFGAANVSYTVAANLGSAARVGTILAASQQLNVTQAGTCAVTVNPNGNTNLPAVGKAGTIILATTQPACAWSGTSSAEWAQFFPASGTGNANLALTIYPNFGSQSRNATLIIGGQSVTMTQAGSTANSTARFLQSMYFGYLARLPSQGEIDFHANTLTKGLTRTDVAFNLFNSAEFNAGGRFVAGLYVGLLDRDPEFAGWLFQRRALFENAVDQTALVSNFMTSAEYIAKFGNPNPAQFVTLLYRYILLRDPSPAEVDFQVRNALSDGSLAKRIALAAAFLNAAEFKTGAGPRLSAFLLYSTLLQRAGSQADRDFQAEAIRKGTPLKDLIGAFLGTAEFTNLLN